MRLKGRCRAKALTAARLWTANCDLGMHARLVRLKHVEAAKRLTTIRANKFLWMLGLLMSYQVTSSPETFRALIARMGTARFQILLSLLTLRLQLLLPLGKGGLVIIGIDLSVDAFVCTPMNLKLGPFSETLGTNLASEACVNSIYMLAELLPRREGTAAASMSALVRPDRAMQDDMPGQVCTSLIGLVASWKAAAAELQFGMQLEMLVIPRA